MLILLIICLVIIVLPALGALFGLHKESRTKVDKTPWPYNQQKKR